MSYTHTGNSEIRYSPIYLVIKHSRTPVIWTVVIRIAIHPNRLDFSDKFVKNSTNLTCLDITGYVFKYSTVLWLLEFQFRRGREIRRRCILEIVTAVLQTAQCNLFAKKNQIIRIFCISGWLAVPINTFAASYLNTQGLNNSCLKSPASTLVDLTFQSRILRSFSLNQLRNLSL